MKAVILAAGKGTRLRPLTYSIPKPVIRINKKTIIERILDILISFDIKEIVLITGYKEELIKEKCKNYKNLTFIKQEEQKGTAHATLQAESFIKDSDFIQINGDLVFSKNIIKKLIEKTGYDAVLAVREVEDVKKFGILKLKKDLAKKIIEKPDPKEAPSNLANMGMYKFSPEIFKAIKETKINPKRNEFEITDSIQILMNKNKVSYVLCNEPWIGVEDEADLEKAKKIVKNEHI